MIDFHFVNVDIHILQISLNMLNYDTQNYSLAKQMFLIKIGIVTTQITKHQTHVTAFNFKIVDNTSKLFIYIYLMPFVCFVFVYMYILFVFFYEIDKTYVLK